MRFARDADPKKPYGDTAAFQSNIPESVVSASGAGALSGALVILVAIWLFRED